MKKLLSRIFGGEITAKKLLLAFVLVLVTVLGIGLYFGWNSPRMDTASSAAAPAGNSSSTPADNSAPADNSTAPNSSGSAAPASTAPPADRPVDPSAAQAVPAEVQALLGSIPYYGDVSKCAMTAGQASAYAQVIADGIAGKYSKDDMQFTYDGSSEPFFWEISNGVLGPDPYQTNRANVILADFEANGVPYLYVFSSLVDSCSYSVYGWADGHAKFVTGAENYNGRSHSSLYESGSGAVVLGEEAYISWGSYIGGTYTFSNGDVNLAYTWDVSVVWDEALGKEVLRVTTNGKATDYPASTDYLEGVDIAVGAGPCQPVDMETRNLPYAPFSEVESRPATLRQMVNVLNDCASILSGGKSQPVVVRELSGTQLMAEAMLEKLSELSANGAEPEAHLLDMNADGTPELIYYDANIEESSTGGYRVFRWDGQKLYEHQFDYLNYYVDKKLYGYNIAKYRNEYAFAFLDMPEDNMLCGFYFLDRTDELLEGTNYYFDLDDGEEKHEHYFLYNGKEVSIDEYHQLSKEYNVGSLSWSHVGKADLPDAKPELLKLLAG